MAIRRTNWGGRARSLVILSAVALLASACIDQPPSTPPPTGTAQVTVGSQTVTVTVPAGQTVVISPASNVPTAPAGVSFPSGAFDVDVNNAPIGGVVAVHVTFTTRVDGVRKLINGVWDLFRFDGVTGAVVADDGMSAILHLQDGGRGDTDGAANGTIADPFAPEQATTLTILTDSLPVGASGNPYSFTLQAVGAAGPVTWSLLEGNLPAGVTLDPSGLLSGTPTSSGMFRVQATDGTATTSKLLFSMLSIGSSPGSTGAALPDGHYIAVSSAAGLGTYDANGTMSVPAATSIRSAADLYGVNLVSGGLLAPLTTLGTNNGPVEVREVESGAPVQVVDPATDLSSYLGWFSPDSRYLYLMTFKGVMFPTITRRVYDTSTWQVVRDSSTGVWSPDSTEVLGLPIQPWPVQSLTDPSGASDRALPIPAECTGYPEAFAWGAANRLALSCRGTVTLGDGSQMTVFTLLTMSAIDGSQVRVLSTVTCTQVSQCTRFALAGSAVTASAAFSPDGRYLALTETTSASASPPSESRVAYIEDAPGAAAVYLTPATPGVLANALGWR